MSYPALRQTLFFYNACFPLHIRQAHEDVATLQRGAADVNKEAFEGAEA